MIGLTLLSGISYGQRLSLESAKQQALENNFKVKNSKLETAVAKEVKKDAYTKYFPQVSANVMGMKAIDPLLKMSMEGGQLPVYDGNVANLANPTQFAYMPGVNMGLFNQMALGAVNLQQPIYAGGKIGTGNELAALDVEVKEKQEVLTKNEVLLKTEEQYWLVVSLQEKQKTLDNYIEVVESLHRQVSNAYKNGLILKNDLLKVSIKQSELEVSKTQLENGKKLAMMQLCQTMGIDYSEGIVLKEELNALQEPVVYMVPHEEAINNRAEYQLFEKGVQASALQMKMQKGDYLPTFGVGVTGYYLDQLESKVKGSFNGMVYASLSVPISDLWNKKHKQNELRYKEGIAKNTLQDGKGLLKLQMEKALIDLMEANKRVKLMEQTLEQTIENVTLNERSYNNGLINLSDLLEAQALKTATEDKLIEAKNRYKIAVTNYLQVTGR